MNHNAPAWLENVVIEGLQGLKAASLRGAPAQDTITATLDVWLHAMMSWSVVWDRELDEARVREGFRTLFGAIDQWPAPTQLRAFMPSRPERLALPAPQSHGYPPGVREQIAGLTAKLRRGANEVTAHDLLAQLQRHVGAANGASAADLARWLNTNERLVRRLVTELIESQGIAVCGRPETGYFIAETEAEIADTVEFHRSRALHELKKASRLSKKPLQELAGQLLLNT